MINNTLKSALLARFSNCLSTSCRERQCGLRLDSLRRSSMVIIDGRKYQELFRFSESLCDRIVFHMEGNTTVAVVELKSGRLDAQQSTKQLINGAQIAEDAMGSAYRANNFLPMVLRGRRTHTAELKVLGNAKLRFQDKEYSIILERCESSLKSIIEKYCPF